MAHPFGKSVETAPMIRATWGEALSPVIAAIIVARPHFGPRFALAPRKVIHSLAAYVCTAFEQGLEPQATAAAIDAQDIRDLLEDAIPNVHPRLYGMLDRLGDKSLSLAVYHQMNGILQGPASDLLLACELVNEPGLVIIGVIANDPVLLAAQRAIGNNTSNLNVVISAVAYVRASGLSVDVEQLPMGSGWRALKRRITADLARANAPPLKSRQPQGWRHVETMSETLRIGFEMENCIATFDGGGGHHLFNFMSSNEVFFISPGEPRGSGRSWRGWRVGRGCLALPWTRDGGVGSDAQQSVLCIQRHAVRMMVRGGPRLFT